MNSKCFKDWIKDEWSLQGGLVTPAIAAKILKITRGGIASYQKKKKVKIFTDPEGKTMLSYAEVMNLANDKENNGTLTKKTRKTAKTPLSVESTAIPEDTKKQ